MLNMFLQASILFLISCQLGQANQPNRVPTYTSPSSGQCAIPEDTRFLQYKENISDIISQRINAYDGVCPCSDHRNSSWTRVAYLNMSESSQFCPRAWAAININTTSIRACGRQSSSSGSCDSVFYSTNGLSYSHVCGRINGYQFNSPNAFNSSVTGSVSLDSWYVDGVSLTYGLPGARTHVWTFANAWYETNSNNRYKCPCMFSNPSDWTYTVPSFVGNNYFCATGSTNNPGSVNLAVGLLWDGIDCTGSNTCCQFNQPPWFCRTLPTTTRDDLEVRICGDQETDNENTYISLVEIFVQ